ncbi:unnamed protein product, partial [Phaeothamnion confervicola]
MPSTLLYMRYRGRCGGVCQRRRPASPRHFLLLSLLLGSVWRRPYFTLADFNVALHAQVSPDAGFIVGSVITTAGMRAALLSGAATGLEGAGEGNFTAAVDHGQIFYPFSYDGLHDRAWDLVIIEGWFEMINAFIHEVRSLSLPAKHTRVLFYCLDPELPGMSHLAALDVDGFLTNSPGVRIELAAHAPTALVPLAADATAFPFFPTLPPLHLNDNGASQPLPSLPPPQTQQPQQSQNQQRQQSRVVYVGAAGALAHKRMLGWFLRAAAPFGLDVYGSGWGDVPEFSPHWRGVLPPDKLAETYGISLAVLAVTMDDQRARGMVNNRVFEALATGAPLITDTFPALEEALGDAAFYVRSPADVRRHLAALRAEEQKEDEESRRASVAARAARRALIESRHTWRHRMRTVLDFAAALPSGGGGGGSGGFLIEGAAVAETLGESDSAFSAAAIATVPSSGVDSVVGAGAAAGGSCSRKGCFAIALVVDPGLRFDPTFATSLVPAVNELGKRCRVVWFHLSPSARAAAAAFGGRAAAGSSSDGGMNVTAFCGGVSMAELRGFDAVWAAGAVGGAADCCVRAALAVAAAGGEKEEEPRALTLRLAPQLRGLLLWGWNGDSGDAAAVRLPWYDVVFYRTEWERGRLLAACGSSPAEEAETPPPVHLVWAWGMGPTRSPAATNAFAPVDSAASAAGSAEESGAAGAAMAAAPQKRFALVVVGTAAQVFAMAARAGVAGADVSAAFIVLVGSGSKVASGRQPLLPQSPLQQMLNAAGFGGRGLRGLPSEIPISLVDPEGKRPLQNVLAVLVRGPADLPAAGAAVAAATQLVVLPLDALDATWTAATATAAAEEERRATEETMSSASDMSSMLQEWVMLLAARSGRTPAADDDWGALGERSLDFARFDCSAWDWAGYAAALDHGMTRCLCLGVSGGAVMLSTPADGAVLAVPSTVPLAVTVRGFWPGRDGQWCIVADTTTVLVCITRADIRAALRVVDSAAGKPANRRVLPPPWGSDGGSDDGGGIGGG